MRRFVWPLERVLEVRRAEEQTKRGQLLSLTEKLAETRGRLLLERNRLADLVSAVNAEVGGWRLSRQELFLRYSACNDERIRKLAKRECRLQSEQKAKIAELLRVRRFRKGLEKLRTEAEEKFFREQSRRERKMLDEVATGRFARQLLSKERDGL